MPSPLPSQEDLIDKFEYRDGDLYWKHSGKRLGTMTKGGYLRCTMKGRSYLLHRLIWKLHYGVDPGPCLDHINRFKSDNRIENLREVTHSENLRNNNAKDYYPHSDGRYQAMFWDGSKSKYLGLYDTPEEAQRVSRQHKELVQSTNF